MVTEQRAYGPLVINSGLRFSIYSVLRIQSTVPARPSLHFYGMIILVKKGSLQRNGLADIPKIKIKNKLNPKFPMFDDLTNIRHCLLSVAAVLVE